MRSTKRGLEGISYFSFEGLEVIHILLGCCGKYKIIIINKTSRIEMGYKFFLLLLFCICYTQERSGESVISFAKRTSQRTIVTYVYV